MLLKFDIYPKNPKKILKSIGLNNFEVVLSNLDAAVPAKIKNNEQNLVIFACFK